MSDSLNIYANLRSKLSSVVYRWVSPTTHNKHSTNIPLESRRVYIVTHGTVTFQETRNGTGRRRLAKAVRIFERRWNFIKSNNNVNLKTKIVIQDVETYYSQLKQTGVDCSIDTSNSTGHATDIDVRRTCPYISDD